MDNPVTDTPRGAAGGPVRAAVRAVAAGYRATWLLLRETWREPFGQTSALHRLWLFPQVFIASGVAVLVGLAQGYWSPLAASVVSVSLLVLGFGLTAIVGRMTGRRRLDEK